MIIPNKNQNEALKIFHSETCHKNYHFLYDKIISEGFYWNNIVESCKKFIKDCDITQFKNKAIFIPPPSNQILCKKLKELFVIDITDIPQQLYPNKKKTLYFINH